MPALLPDAIKHLRGTLELTQERMARELEMTVRGVSRWEAGARPDIATVAKLCRLAQRFGRADLGKTVASAFEKDVIEDLRADLTDCMY